MVSSESILKPIWIRESFPWMGSYSGYEVLCDTISEEQSIQCQNIYSAKLPYPKVTAPLISPVTARFKRSLTYNQAATWVELKTLAKTMISGANLIHAVYAERSIGLLPEAKRWLPFKVIGTVHQPSGLWRLGRHNPEAISVLDALIVLSHQEVEYFNQYLPNKVHFIPHGVDLNFFSPATEPGEILQTDGPRCIFCGSWLRDLKTLSDIIDTLVVKEPNLKFDLVVPISKRHHPDFYKIARHPQVSWHAGISDHQLKDLYRQASVILLPLLDCTANNALLEAIACGVPVVSNEVGGVPDYTRPSFADLLPVGDVHGMTEAILHLIEDKVYQTQRGRAARSFAEQHLGWDKIAEKTVSVYRKALQDIDT